MPRAAAAVANSEGMGLSEGWHMGGRRWAMAAAAGATLALFLSQAGEPGLRDRSAVRDGVHRALADAGFAVNEVHVGGQRVTDLDDIFSTLDVSPGSSIFGFDRAAAGDRLRRLPWVAEAHIARRLPDTLVVEIVERTARAVWSDGEVSALLDGEGRTLSAITPRMAPDGLVRVSGAGAPAAFAALDAMLARHGDLRRRLADAEWVGGQRWVLRLDGGVRVLLPRRGAGEALDNFAILERTGQIAGASEVDLSDADRTARPAELPAPAPAAAAGRG